MNPKVIQEIIQEGSEVNLRIDSERLWERLLELRDENARLWAAVDDVENVKFMLLSAIHDEGNDDPVVKAAAIAISNAIGKAGC